LAREEEKEKEEEEEEEKENGTLIQVLSEKES
jgi:hypothetical protein